jgi:hypothetical protein
MYGRKDHESWLYLGEAFVAVLALAAGQSSIQKRLEDAYISALIRLKPDDFPDDLQDDFRKLQDELTSVEGSVAVSTRAMSGDRASEIAEQIVSMFNQVARKYPEKD